MIPNFAELAKKMAESQDDKLLSQFAIECGLIKVWNLAIDQCAETAEVHWEEDYDTHEVAKDSIIKNKIQ